jgi:cardiolipin synthase
MSRIVASPLLSVAIAYDMKVVALGGCVVFGLTDWLDGYLAKKLNQRTVLGAFLDPMADKVLIGALTLG